MGEIQALRLPSLPTLKRSTLPAKCFARIPAHSPKAVGLGLFGPTLWLPAAQAGAGVVSDRCTRMPDWAASSIAWSRKGNWYSRLAGRLRAWRCPGVSVLAQTTLIRSRVTPNARARLSAVFRVKPYFFLYAWVTIAGSS